MSYEIALKSIWNNHLNNIPDNCIYYKTAQIHPKDDRPVTFHSLGACWVVLWRPNYQTYSNNHEHRAYDPDHLGCVSHCSWSVSVITPSRWNRMRTTLVYLSIFARSRFKTSGARFSAFRYKLIVSAVCRYTRTTPCVHEGWNRFVRMLTGCRDSLCNLSVVHSPQPPWVRTGRCQTHVNSHFVMFFVILWFWNYDCQTMQNS